MKKILLFIFFFLFINVYAANDFSLQCEYKTSDATYRVIIPLRDNNVNYIAYDGATISKMSSETGGYTEPEDVRDLSYFVGHDQILGRYGVSSISVSFTWLSDDYDEFVEDFTVNSSKYCPILMFNDKDEPVLFGSYFNSEFFKETEKLGIYNANESKEYFEKLLRGELTPIDSPAIGIESINFYEKLRLKKELYYATYSSKQNVNMDDDITIDWNASTCKEYDFLFKQLREKVAGKDGNGGVCSGASLNAMQRTGSLYDLINNFDRSILEEECREYVFGNGAKSYINTIVDAQMYYMSFINDSDKAYSLSCLSMQSGYLKGITLLTSYVANADNQDSTGCELIGEDVLNFINELFNVFKIICTVVCIYLCIMDGYKVVVSKDGDMSKFQKSLAKRIIALVVIFLLPIFISIISEYINERYMESKGDICIGVSKTSGNMSR